MPVLNGNKLSYKLSVCCDINCVFSISRSVQKLYTWLWTYLWRKLQVGIGIIHFHQDALYSPSVLSNKHRVCTSTISFIVVKGMAHYFSLLYRITSFPAWITSERYGYSSSICTSLWTAPPEILLPINSHRKQLWMTWSGEKNNNLSLF